MAEEKKNTTAKQQKKQPAKKDSKTENKPKQNKQTNNSDKPKKSNNAKAEKLLEYKGKPLVRCANTVYYGNMNDPYVVCLNIKNTTDLKDIKLAGTVAIQLISTDESLSPKDRMIKKSEKQGLFTALDLGAAWLERQLKKG